MVLDQVLVKMAVYPAADSLIAVGQGIQIPGSRATSRIQFQWARFSGPTLGSEAVYCQQALC